MSTFHRTPNTFNITTGTPTAGSSVQVSGAPYYYYTDDEARFKQTWTVPKTNGSYSSLSVWSRSTDPSTFAEIRVDVTVQGSDINYKTYGRSGLESLRTSISWTLELDETLANTVTVTAQHEHFFKPYTHFGQGTSRYDDTKESASSSGDTIQFTDINGTPASPVSVQVRVFAIQGGAMSNGGQVDPNIPNTSYTTGSVYGFPQSSTWEPASPMDRKLEVYDYLGNVIHSVTGTIIVVSKDPSGHIAAFGSLSWDGKVSGEYVTGTFQAKMKALATVPGGGQSYSETPLSITVLPVEDCPPNEKEKQKRDPCKSKQEGQVVASVVGNLGLTGSVADMTFEMVQRSANSEKEPTSFGFGWSSSLEEKLMRAASDTKIVHWFGGRFEVWNRVWNSDDYEAAFPDNHTILEEDSGDNSYLLTYKSKVTKRFHPLDSAPTAGMIEWKKDRNGNTTYFHYDSNGKLEGISDAVLGNGDPDQRVLRFTYPTTGSDEAKAQPNKIIVERKDNGTVLSSRETTITLHSSTNVSQHLLIDRVAEVENPEGETQKFLYYADDTDYRFGKLYQILDARDHIVVEYDYHNDTHVRLKSEKSFYDPGTGVAAQMKREYTYQDNTPYNGNTKLTVVETDLTGVSGATRTTVTYSYDSGGTVFKTEETIGSETRVTERIYGDVINNPYSVTKIIDPNLEFKEFTYNSNGNLLTSKDKLGRVTSIEYLSTDPDLIEKIKRPLLSGQAEIDRYTTTFAYDSKNNLQSITDAAGKTTTLKLRNGVDHAATDGQVWKIIDRRWDGSPSTENDFATIFDYYADGNLKSIQSPIGPGAHPGTKLTFEYDDFDNLIEITDELGNEWKSVYDDLDRLVESEDARGKKSYLEYSDGLLAWTGLPSNEGPSGTQSMNVGKATQARKSQFTYDYPGRVTKVESNDSASTVETRVEYEYTGFSEMHKMIRLIDGLNKTTEWSYDQLGRLVEMVDSLARSTTRVYEPYCKEFTQTSPRGIVTTNNFDVMCRPSLIESTSEELEYEYDELGRLTNVIQREVTLYSDDRSDPGRRRVDVAKYQGGEEEWEYEYDALDRMTKATYPNGEEILYTYGDEGELLQVTDTDDKVTKYVYNNDLSLQKVQIWRSGSLDSEFVYTYDAGGRVSKIEYPDGIELHFDDGGSPATSGWNANGQLIHMRWLKDDGMSGLDLIRSFAYDYDDSGNRIEMFESNGTPAQDIEWQYRYDWFDRLVQVKRGVGGATPALQREYVYDESDNRTYMDDHVGSKTYWYKYKTTGSGGSQKYSDELAEVLVATGVGKRAPADVGDFSSLETFVTDDDGNMLNRTDKSVNPNVVTHYEWDDFNNLLNVDVEGGKLTRNLYDAGSIREEMLKDSGERVKSFFSGGATINETSSTTSNNISYLMGHQLMGFEKNGDKFYFLTDGLSSVRAVLDDTATVVASFEHDEFGRELSASGFSPKTYVGGLGVHDDTAETGLLYMRRRHYDPNIGRFLNGDPIGLSGGLNLFSYAANSPTTMVDSDGLNPATAVKTGGDEPAGHIQVTGTPSTLGGFTTVRFKVENHLPAKANTVFSAGVSKLRYKNGKPVCWEPAGKFFQFGSYSPGTSDAGLLMFPTPFRMAQFSYGDSMKISIHVHGATARIGPKVGYAGPRSSTELFTVVQKRIPNPLQQGKDFGVPYFKSFPSEVVANLPPCPPDDCSEDK